MSVFLKLKHWQIFLIQITGMVLLYTSFSDATMASIMYALSFIAMHLWLLAIGLEINNYLKPRGQKSNTLFVINYILITGGYGFMAMTGIMHVTFTGFYTLIGLYVFYAYIQIFIYGANSLNRLYGSVARKEEESSINLFFLLIFWPIGLWFIQPKLNKIILDKELLEKD